jgi:hypothetical protein
VNQRPERPPALLHSRWTAPLAAVAALALLLAWWQPWRTPDQPAPPRPTTTPLPPVATRAPERIALPSERPQPPASPAAPPTTPATPAATPSAAGQGDHTLVYLGTTGGRSGIIAANADGSAPRLLVPGLYDQLAASPDGTRLAATGVIPDGGGSQQLAIFDAAGRPLARHTLGRGTSHPLAWSPSGKYLLHTILVGGNAETRVFTDTEARQITPPSLNASFPYAWIPGDRIVYFVHQNSSQSRPLALWTIDVAGGDPREHITSNFVPVGPNGDGTLFYALSPGDAADQSSPMTQLVAIDLRSGGTTPVIAASDLVATTPGLPSPAGTYNIGFANLAPDASTLAVGLFRSADPGAPIPPAEARTGYLVLMQPSGRVTGVAQLPPDGYLGPSAWSPDGSRLALYTLRDQSSAGQLHIFDPAGNRAQFTADRAPAGRFPQFAWSPDGTRLIATSAQGLVLIALDPPRAHLIAPGGTSPAWLPRPASSPNP